VIAGRNDAELRLAAAALASAKGIHGGSAMSFDGTRVPTWPRYGAPRWITTDRPVKLGELVPSYGLQGMGLPPARWPRASASRPTCSSGRAAAP
jgi:cellulose synthase (UDP-forming)